jgi:asparagine synthase (glutamine-hydrolysing)
VRCDHLLAVSADPRAAPRLLVGLRDSHPERLLPGLVRDIDDVNAVPVATPMAGGTVWSVGWTPSPIRPSEGRQTLFGLSADPVGGDYSPVVPDELLGQMDRADPALARIAAPFAAACVDEHGRFTAVADAMGLRHLYAVQAPGWAAVSTSARVLGELTAAPLDAEALGVYRLAGMHLGLTTPFQGVSKLSPGCLWRLADGRLTTVEYGTYTAPYPPDQESFDAASAAAQYGRLLCSIVEACLDRDARTILELSGGFDSRLILAAVPPARRTGLRALTIAVPGSEDAPVAMAIARRFGLRHEVVDLAGLGRVDAAAAYALVHRAAARHDGLGDPLVLAVLDWVEGRNTASVRLTGLAGEMVRGAFPFEPASAGVSAQRVDRLARWWITNHDLVPDRMLTPDFAGFSRALTRERLQKVFGEYGTDWQTATDLFYLRERVHRWGGITATGGCLARTIVAPSLDARMLDSAFCVPQRERRGSRFAARVMAGLDAQLAAMPMASGVRPAALTRPVSGPRRLGERTILGFAGEVAATARRLVRAGDRPAHGARLLASKVVEHWRANPHLLEPAVRTGLVNAEAVDRLLDGRGIAGAVNAPTIGFLVNLTVVAGGLPEQRRWIDADL